MQNTKKVQLRTFFRKRSVRFGISGLLLVLLILLLIPFGAKFYIVDWLQKNGADKASITSLRYNPFAGKIMLKGLDVHAQGHPILKNADMVLDMGLSALINKDIRIEFAEYRELFIDLEQYPDGRWRIASYTTPEDRQEATVVTPEDGNKPWGFLADHILLEECSVQLKTSQLETKLFITRAELNTFTTRENSPAGSFTLTGLIDDSPVEIDLNSLQVAPELDIKGRVKLDALNAEKFKAFVEQVLPTLAGKISLDGDVSLHLQPEATINAAYDGTLQVDQTALGSPDFSTSAARLAWDGNIQYNAPPNKPASLITDGKFSVTSFNFTHPPSNLNTSEKAIDLQGKTELLLGETLQITHQGSFGVQQLEVQLPDIQLKKELLQWQGALSYKAPSDSQNIVLKGTLTAKKLAADLQQAGLTIEQDQFSLDFDNSITVAKQVDVKGVSSAQLTNLSLKNGLKDSAPLVHIAKGNLTALQAQGGTSFSLKSLVLEESKAAVDGEMPLTIQVPRLELSEFSTDLEQYNLKQLMVNDVKAISTVAGKELGAISRIHLGPTSATAEPAASVSQLTVEGITLLKTETQQDPICALKDIQLKDFSWNSSDGLQGSEIAINDLLVDLFRDKEGELNLNQRLAAFRVETPEDPNSEETAPEQPDDTVKEKPPIRITTITMGGKNRIVFEDSSMASPFSANLNISKLLVENLDSTLPEKQATLVIEGELDERAPLHLAGDISLFTPAPQLDLKLKLKNYPLSSLSPYTIQSVGTALASGQLKVTSSLELADNQLDLKNDILLQQLKTETISKELAAELDNQLPVPLDAALTLLRDSDKNIALSIPLKGPVDDLKVGIGDIVMTAVSKSIVSAASSYFVYTLGPYAALAYVGMKVGKEMMEVSLPPVVYQPGDALLTKDHEDYLTRIAKILQDRPGTDIQLIPQVMSSEFQSAKPVKGAETAAPKTAPLTPAMKEKLLALGQQRAKSIQNHLIQNHKIEKQRLLLAESVITEDKDTSPQVILKIE